MELGMLSFAPLADQNQDNEKMRILSAGIQLGEHNVGAKEAQWTDLALLGQAMLSPLTAPPPCCICCSWPQPRRGDQELTAARRSAANHNDTVARLARHMISLRCFGQARSDAQRMKFSCFRGISSMNLDGS